MSGARFHARCRPTAAVSWSVKDFAAVSPVTTPGAPAVMPAPSSTAVASPHAAMTLQWRKASCRSSVSLISLVAVVPPATTRASNSTERAVSSVRSTVWVLVPLPRTPPAGAMTRTDAPSLAAAFRTLLMPGRSEPASAMMPILRPVIGLTGLPGLPLPSPISCDVCLFLLAGRGRDHGRVV
jgi:hypothetical protein